MLIYALNCFPPGTLIYAYQLLANEQLTKENIRLARIVAWCVELVCNLVMYVLFLIRL